MLVGWVNYFKIAKCKTFLINLDRMIRKRIRVCIWKTWKKVRTRYRNLIKLGLSRYKAWEWANTRKGYTRVAMSYVLTTTITNKRLEKRGLLSASKYFLELSIR